MPPSQWRCACSYLHHSINLTVECLARQLHRADLAVICLIVLRRLVGELRNEHVSEVLWSLYESYTWRGYPSLPQPLLLTDPLIPGDAGHPLRDMGIRPSSCTAPVDDAQQDFFRICALQRLQLLLAVEMFNVCERASIAADEAVSEWRDAVDVLEVPLDVERRRMEHDAF